MDYKITREILHNETGDVCVAKASILCPVCNERLERIGNDMKKAVISLKEKLKEHMLSKHKSIVFEEF